jgi:ribosome recycling factor
MSVIDKLTDEERLEVYKFVKREQERERRRKASEEQKAKVREYQRLYKQKVRKALKEAK